MAYSLIQSQPASALCLWNDDVSTAYIANNATVIVCWLLLLQRENLADPDNYTLAATGRLQLSDSTVLRATLQVRARKAGKRMQVNLCAHIPDSIYLVGVYLVGVSVGHLCASRCKFINTFCTSASPTVQPHSTLAGALIKDTYSSPHPMLTFILDAEIVFKDPFHHLLYVLLPCACCCVRPTAYQPCSHCCHSRNSGSNRGAGVAATLCTSSSSSDSSSRTTSSSSSKGTSHQLHQQQQHPHLPDPAGSSSRGSNSSRAGWFGSCKGTLSRCSSSSS